MDGLRPVELLLSLTVLTAIVAGAASAQPSSGAPGKGAKQPSATTVTPKALQGPVKLAPALVKEATGVALPPDWDAEVEAHKALHSRYVPWNLHYSTYKGHVESCLSKDHTVADQKAAGCLPSDTLAVCADKIYNACLAHPSRKMAEMDISGLVSAAQKLSAEAATLAKRIPNALPKFRELPAPAR
jgi:hypothetical protein